MNDIDDIDHRLKGLKADLKSYGDDILNIVNAQYGDSINNLNIDMKNEPRNSIYILRQDLTDILSQQMITSNEEKTNVNRNIDVNKDLKYCENYLEMLETVTMACDLLEEVDALIESSDLKKICETLNELKIVIKRLPNESTDFGAGYVCKHLRKEYGIVKSRFYIRLKRLLDCCISISAGRLHIKKELCGVVPDEDYIIDSPISLQDIWKSLLAMENATDCINYFVSNLWLNLVKPLWKERKSPPVKSLITHATAEFLIELSVKESSITSSAFSDSFDSDNHLSVSKSIQSKDKSQLLCRMPVPSLLDLLGQVLCFCFVEVFSGIESLSQIVAKALFSPPQSLLVSLYDTILLAQPKMESDLHLYQKSLERPIKELEKRLITYNLFGYHSLQINSDQTVDAAGKEARDYILEQLKKLENRSTYKGISNEQPLTTLLQQLNNRYLEFRRKEILSQAREYILADYHNIMLATGDALEDETSSAGSVGDPKAILEQSGHYALQVLQFDPCQISLVSCRLLKLIHEILKQIFDPKLNESNEPLAMNNTPFAQSSAPTSTSTILCKVLIQSIRDCLELFLAIIPVKYSEIIYSSSRMAAVFYNDCLYIVHNTTLITHLYRSNGASSDNSEVTQHHELGFIDLIPRFRAEAEKILTYHISQQKSVFSDLVQEINITPQVIGKSRSDISAAKSNPVNNEQGVNKLLNNFSALRDQWKDVLQDPVYHRVIGYLLESVLRALMEPLFATDCIEETAASEISRIFRSVQRIR